MARMPKADWLGEHSPRSPMERYDIVAVHTIVGFAPAHAAHFSVWSNGRIGQSRDTAFRSAANLNGNHRVIAIENEDAAKDVPLTPEQVESNARILAWAHRTHGIPLQLCPDSKPGSRGLAYHRQGIDGNFDGFRFPGRVPGGEVWSTSFGKTCPRDNRIAQLPAILARAKQIVEGSTPVPADLVVVAGNLHNDPAAARYLARRSRPDHPDHFDIGLVSEAQKFRPRRILSGMVGHRYRVGPRGMGDNDAARETGILTSHLLPDLGGGSYFVTPRAPKFARVGKERWGHDDVTRFGGVEIAAVTIHPVPAPADLRSGDTDGALVDRHEKAIRWAASTVKHHRRLGREVVFGGDVNVREHWAGAAALANMLERFELSGIWDGLDLLVASPGLEVVSASADDFPSNHPLLRLELNLRKGK